MAVIAASHKRSPGFLTKETQSVTYCSLLDAHVLFRSYPGRAQAGARESYPRWPGRAEFRARLPALAPAASPSASPAAPPSVAPAATAANELDNQEERQRANSGVDDRGDDTRAKVDAELKFSSSTKVSSIRRIGICSGLPRRRRKSGTVSCTGTMWGVSLCTPRRETPLLQHPCGLI
jgi:hypothetical protein